MSVTQLDYRMVMHLSAAHRATRVFPKSRPSNAAAKVGLAYENRIGKELEYHKNMGRIVRVEHNPWFTFYDMNGSGHCCPDFLLQFEDRVVIVEVKLTWVEVAIHKLNNLYGPVVASALGWPVYPLVICRNVTPATPKPKFTLREALASTEPVLHWPHTGRLQW